MPPNATSSSSSALLTVSSIRQPQQQQPSKMATLRRSPPTFGCRPAQYAMEAMCQQQQQKQHHSSSCPAPVSQVELQFVLMPSSSSSSSSASAPSPALPLRINVRTPGGDRAHMDLHLDSPSRTFCLRHSARCGHGQWTLQIGDHGPEQQLRLDGVGSLQFGVHLDNNGGGGGHFELREQQFLRVPGSAFCGAAAMADDDQ